MFPLTVNGRSLAEEVTGGAAPPRVPVKVCSLARSRVRIHIEIKSMDILLAEAATDAAAETEGVAEASTGAAGQAFEAEEAVELAAGAEAEVEPAELAELPAAMFATAAVISAAVASSTRRFCEKMQPSTSSATSQVLPLAVGSPI